MERTHEDEAECTANYTTHDIGIVSNFTMLIHLEILGATLNSRYPFLFSIASRLDRLKMINCGGLLLLLWHLDDLATSSALKELHCEGTPVKGNIKCLKESSKII